jgi:hypothetical protein
MFLSLRFANGTAVVDTLLILLGNIQMLQELHSSLSTYDYC